MEAIVESDMSFGPYSDADIFYIEKSTQYRKYLMPKGVKCCEFLLRKGKKMYFIEAKKTNPKETTAESTEEKKAKYNAYISDITTKMRHSLAVYASILLRRYDFEGVPEDMQKRDLSHIEITLLLVVKEAEPQWLIPLQDKLNKELKKDTSIWRNVNLCVINEDKAREKHFVT